MEGDFHTLRWYEDANRLSPATEDYIEMLCRLCDQNGEVRLSVLANHLNVGVSAASKMAVRLRAAGFLSYQAYGALTLTEKGKKEGARLLARHKILNEFFSTVNKTPSELELVEKIEHFFDETTVENLRTLLERLQNDVSP